MLQVEALLQDISAALGNGQYYVALFAALVIPDICAALESKDGQATGPRYIAWFDKHVVEPGDALTGADAYAFRCGMLHQGTTLHPRSSWDRVLFLEPNPNVMMHNNIINGALNLDLLIFTQHLVVAARVWQRSVAGTEPYESNASSMIRRHPLGLSPYVGGVPVIS